MRATAEHMHDEEMDEESTVDVERMPDVGGWELYKAIDSHEERERWTLGFRREPPMKKGSYATVTYALWLDPSKDPDSSGILDGSAQAREPWAGSAELDDEGREALVMGIIKKVDPSFEDYGYRVALELEKPADGGTDELEQEDDDEFDD